MSNEVYKAAVEAMKHAYKLLLNPEEFNAACYGVDVLAIGLNLSKDEIAELEDVWTNLVAKKYAEYDKRRK